MAPGRNDLIGGNAVVRERVAKPEIGFLKGFSLLLFFSGTSLSVCRKESQNCALGNPYLSCQPLY